MKLTLLGTTIDVIDLDGVCDDLQAHIDRVKEIQATVKHLEEIKQQNHEAWTARLKALWDKVHQEGSKFEEQEKKFFEYYAAIENQLETVEFMRLQAKWYLVMCMHLAIINERTGSQSRTQEVKALSDELLQILR